jgi:hypothetical protein
MPATIADGPRLKTLRFTVSVLLGVAAFLYWGVGGGGSASPRSDAKSPPRTKDTAARFLFDVLQRRIRFGYLRRSTLTSSSFSPSRKAFSWLGWVSVTVVADGNLSLPSATTLPLTSSSKRLRGCGEKPADSGWISKVASAGGPGIWMSRRNLTL